MPQFAQGQSPNGCNPAVASPLLAALLPPGVATAELREPGRAALLFASEAAYCARFAPKRVADFAAGRLCARRALGELGITGFPLDANADRSPRWPDGFTGSITHTDRFCAAAAADAGRFVGIGIDAETIGRVTEEMHSLIFTAAERITVDSLAGLDRARAQTIVFSAKEAFYKCQFAVTRAWRDFHDVTIQLLPSEQHDERQSGEFVVRPSPTTSVTAWGVALPLRGRFVITDELVVTAAAVTVATRDVSWQGYDDRDRYERS